MQVEREVGLLIIVPHEERRDEGPDGDRPERELPDILLALGREIGVHISVKAVDGPFPVRDGRLFLGRELFPDRTRLNRKPRLEIPDNRLGGQVDLESVIILLLVAFEGTIRPGRDGRTDLGDAGFLRPAGSYPEEDVVSTLQTHIRLFAQAMHMSVLTLT